MRAIPTLALPVLCLAAAASCAGGPGAAREEEPGVVERFLTPDPTPLPAAAVGAVEAEVRRHVAREAFPGAAFAVGNRALVQHRGAAGRVAWDSAAPAVHADSTRFDLASLTKVVATTAAVMALVEDGRMRLDDPVGRHLPAFRAGDRAAVTVRQLLTHRGGVRAGLETVPDGSRAAVLGRVLELPLALEPGADVLYSDVGFLVLWEAAERAAGVPLPQYLRRRVWGPLGMHDTGVGVDTACPRCAPTLHLEEVDRPYRGGSYDELARRLGGETGSAGAFSTAADLARFAAMIANEGRLGRVRVFERATVRAFTRPQPGAGTRALGWEVYCREGVVPDHTPCGQVLAFGHTGVTGTSLWVDPASRSWLVLLTNRTYLPRRETEMQPLRRRLFAHLARP